MENTKVTPTILWEATRTLAMHVENGQCAQCTSDGCGRHEWAVVVRRTWAQQHPGVTLPEVDNAWAVEVKKFGRMMANHGRHVAAG